MSMSQSDGSGDAHEETAAAEEAPGSLWETLVYGLSLPERTARSASVVVAGLVNETAARLIPAAFRSSRSYRVFIQQSLDMLIHDVGGVRLAAAADPSDASKLARKAVGGLLDVTGAATLHLSPMTLLAVFNDLAYGSGHYLKLLGAELKREGIIDAQSSIDHVSDLLEALESASRKAADAVDSPPISLDGLRETVSQLSQEMQRVEPASLIPQSELQRLWAEMEQAAQSADVGLWDVSTTMTMFAMNRVSLTTRGAISSVRVAGNLLDKHLLQHYSDALGQIRERGLYTTLAEVSTPYLDAVWVNFESDRETVTADLVTGRLLARAWDNMRGWWQGGSADSQGPPPP
jgi:hypothetical protein